MTQLEITAHNPTGNTPHGNYIANWRTDRSRVDI